MKKSSLIIFSLVIMLLFQSCSTTQNLSLLAMSETYNADRAVLRSSVINVLKMRGYNYSVNYSSNSEFIVAFKKIEYAPNSVWSAFGKKDKKIKLQVIISSLNSTVPAINNEYSSTVLKLTLKAQEKDTNNDWNAINITTDNGKAYFQKLIGDIDNKISIMRL